MIRDRRAAKKRWKGEEQKGNLGDSELVRHQAKTARNKRENESKFTGRCGNGPHVNADGELGKLLPVTLLLPSLV